MKNPYGHGWQAIGVVGVFVVLLGVAVSCDDDKKDGCERSWDRLVACHLDAGSSKSDYLDQCRQGDSQMKDISGDCWNARQDLMDCTVDMACNWLSASPTDPNNPCYDALNKFMMACFGM